MRKPNKLRDDSELPPKRAKVQEEREADFIASLGLRMTTEDEIEKEIRAELRIIRSDRVTLETAKLSEKDRAKLARELLVQIARIKELHTFIQTERV